MESEGIDSKGDTPSDSYFSFRFAKDAVKLIIEGFSFINVRIAHFSSSFQCGYTYIVCFYSLTYDQKHIGFSTYDIVNIIFM